MYYIFLLTSFSLPFNELSLMRMIGPAFSAMTLFVGSCDPENRLRNDL